MGDNVIAVGTNNVMVMCLWILTKPQTVIILSKHRAASLQKSRTKSCTQEMHRFLFFNKLTWDASCLKYRPKGLQFYKQQLVVSFHLLDAIVTMNSVGVTAWQHTWMLNIFHCTCKGSHFCIMHFIILCLVLSHSGHTWQNVATW